MTKKLSVEVKDQRANLRMSKEAVAEINERAEKLIRPQAGMQDSSTPLEYGEHKDVIRKHEVSGLAAIHAGDYGDDFKCLFYRSLNSMAQRVLRDSLRAELAKLDRPEDEVLSNAMTDEEISEIFGSEVSALYTVPQAAHWVMLTQCVGHSAAMVTEADETGFKTKPLIWMKDHFKTVNQMLYADMAYGIKQSVGNQTAQMTKLDMDIEEVEEAAEKYTSTQTAVGMERFLTKKALTDGTYDRDYYRDLESEGELADLEDMVATLGISVPALMVEVAQSYKDSKQKSARAGKYIGDIDERIVDLAPRADKAARRAALARAQAPEAVAGEQALHTAHLEAILEAPRAEKRTLVRVKKEQAQMMSIH